MWDSSINKFLIKSIVEGSIKQLTQYIISISKKCLLLKMQLKVFKAWKNITTSQKPLCL
jgi:hypothetical protein